MRGQPVCRTAAALTLAPVLALCMWCTAIRGNRNSVGLPTNGTAECRRGCIGICPLSTSSRCRTRYHGSLTKQCPRHGHRQSGAANREVGIVVGSTSCPDGAGHHFRGISHLIGPEIRELDQQVSSGAEAESAHPGNTNALEQPIVPCFSIRHLGGRCGLVEQL